MKQASSLLMLVVVGLALQNNFPSLQSLVPLLPVCVVVALAVYQLLSDRVMAVVVVCLLYGSLSGAFAYAAGVGFAGLGFVWLASRWRPPLALVGIGLTVATQLGFIIVSGIMSPLVGVSFATQLVVILIVSLKLARRGGRDRI